MLISWSGDTWRSRLAGTSNTASAPSSSATVTIIWPALVVYPVSGMRLLWVWSVTRGTGPGWGGCDDPSGARVARGGGAQAGADDALTEAGRGAGSPGADHPARG